jgi:hypothetical protein
MSIESQPAPCKLTTLLASMAAALVVGCASQPDIRLDQDPAVNLADYKTFGFLEPAAGAGARYTSLLNARLRQATREQLERQHYVYSEANPDLRVNVILHVAERQELRSSPGARGPYGYRGWGGGIETVNYRQGTLAIDLVDTKRNALVWQGVAEGRLDDKSIRNPGPAVEAVVGEIFARYPHGIAAR